MGAPWTKRERDDLSREIEAGMNLPDIAKLHERSVNAIKEALATAKSGTQWSEQDINTLKEKIGQGYSEAEVAKILQRTENSIGIKLSQLYIEELRIRYSSTPKESSGFSSSGGTPYM